MTLIDLISLLDSSFRCFTNWSSCVGMIFFGAGVEVFVIDVAVG